MDCEGFNDIVSTFNKNVTEAYNVAAPKKIKQIAARQKMPWFTLDCLAQKRIVRRRERIWLKYSKQHQWEAYKRERARYRNILNYNKKCFITRKIKDCGRDHKKLYSLVRNLTTSEKENHLPKDISDEDLSNKFATFFLEKIKKIRDMFTDAEIYSCDERPVPLMTKFAPVTSTHIRKTIVQMKTKSCESDVIPTGVLKELLDYLLPTLTHVVNSSLCQSGFHKTWKCAIIRPLQKKIGNNYELKNY